jgi:hypothetical protein
MASREKPVLKKMAASSTSRFCLVSKEDIERLIDN